MSADPFGVCLEPNCEDDTPPALPSFAEMAKGFFGSAKDVITGAVHGEGVLVTEDVYISRMDICKTCEFFRQTDSRCSKCGCFMEAKTRFVKTTCPIGKWGSHE